jgi:hypothetical protein
VKPKLWRNVNAGSRNQSERFASELWNRTVRRNAAKVFFSAQLSSEGDCRRFHEIYIFDQRVLLKRHQIQSKRNYFAEKS